MKSLIIMAVISAIISMFASPIFAAPIIQHRPEEYKEYRVYVKQIRSSYYQDQYTGLIIKTHLCLTLAKGDDVVLLWCGKNHPGCGELIFRSGEHCEVVGVYYPKSLPFLFKGSP